MDNKYKYIYLYKKHNIKYIYTNRYNDDDYEFPINPQYSRLIEAKFVDLIAKHIIINNLDVDKAIYYMEKLNSIKYIDQRITLTLQLIENKYDDILFERINKYIYSHNIIPFYENKYGINAVKDLTDSQLELLANTINKYKTKLYISNYIKNIINDITNIDELHQKSKKDYLNISNIKNYKFI